MAKCIKCGCDDPAMSELITSQAIQIERLGRIDRKLDRCVTGLYGPIEEPHKGLIVRVDRLEQHKKAATVGIITIFTTLVALMLNAIASLLGWKS